MVLHQTSCLHVHVPPRKNFIGPANSHGFTLRLTVWGINSRSHDLTSKSQGESENLEIAKIIQVVQSNIKESVLKMAKFVTSNV